MKKFLSLSYPFLRGGFPHEVFLLTLITWINKNSVVKGDLCLSFQGLNKYFLLEFTKSRLREGCWSSNTSLVHIFYLRLTLFSFMQ